MAGIGCYSRPSSFLLDSPPRHGINNERINLRLVAITFRSGHQLICRIRDIFPVIEVFGMRNYDFVDFVHEPIRQIVDVGAHVGASVLWFGRRYAEAKVMAIEPDPEAATMLSANIKRNRLGDRVEIWHVAVGGRREAGTLVKGPTLADGRVVAAGGFGAAKGIGNVVEVVTLEDVLERLGDDIDLLKVDCEGGEFDFLGQATHTALARVNMIVGEYHSSVDHSWLTLERHLTEAGFTVSAKLPATNGVGMFTAVRRGPQTAG